MEKKHVLIFIALFALLIIFGSRVVSANTATTTDIQSKIDERNNQIKQLEAEINQYNLEVTNAQGQAKTLQNTLKTLDLTKKKITTDITLTNTKINKATLTIGQLGTEIDQTQKQIDTNKQAVMTALQNTAELEDVGIFQLILSNKNLSDLWSDMDNVSQVQNVIRDKSKELADLQASMENKQSNLKGQKTSLVSLKQDLSGKQQAVESTAQEKAALLAETKNKEQTFQELVATKQEQRDQFEQEVTDFEAQLNLTVDKSSYPVAKHGILAWPIDNAPTQSSCDSTHKVASCIVRGFSRATVNKKGVTIPGHNGVDFRASVGTRVKSALAGVVAGTGNTDAYRGCYGLGKWVMVNHDDGLSTIYMHLSVISASVGQHLQTGDLIGLSGNTGNSQAPHLHVSVYATEGVRIEQFVNSIGCKQAIVPLADPKAYLDPLAYFPSI